MSHAYGPFSLDGRVALISGGSRGLGYETAEAFLKAGASVMLTDILDADVRAAAKDLSALGKTAALEQDVTHEGRWDEVVAETVKTFGGLDVLVNNAGIEMTNFITDCSYDEYRKQIAVNVDGVWLGMRAAIRAMMPGGPAGKGGSIINLSSVAGLVGVAGFSAYGASKGAVRVMTKHTAVECGKRGLGVRINSVHPGVIPTKMGTDLFGHAVEMGMAKDEAEAEELFKGLFPMGNFGTAADVANAILYLASDASSWVTGAELAIDGGFTAS
ncbi:MAG: glucose 1-dehydrogenase [Pseudomonadota bacterium]